MIEIINKKLKTTLFAKPFSNYKDIATYIFLGSAKDSRAACDELIFAIIEDSRTHRKQTVRDMISVPLADASQHHTDGICSLLIGDAEFSALLEINGSYHMKTTLTSESEFGTIQKEVFEFDPDMDIIPF